MKEMKMRKEIVFLLKPMTKTSQLNGKIQGRCFQMRTRSQTAFQEYPQKSNGRPLKSTKHLVS